MNDRSRDKGVAGAGGWSLKHRCGSQIERCALRLWALNIHKLLAAPAQRMLAAWIALFCALPAWSATAYQYVYDPAGRLVQVIAPAGTSATYAYDPAGNLLKITNLTASTLALSAFSPVSGPVGTTVVIYGSGFSKTASLNTVTFNGTTASVVSATQNVLTVTVPSGATTGSVSVKVSGTTVASSAKFTVAASPLAPTVSGISPSQGSAGASVTISGTNFQTAAGNNRVSFNGGAPATITAASATSLTVTVPSDATSGPVAVSTPYGTAATAPNFYVVPTGTSISSATSLTLSSAQTVSVPNTSGALFTFAGVAGQYIEISIGSSTTLASYTLTMKDPAGAFVLDGAGRQVNYSVSAAGAQAIGPILLPKTGTYTILVTPTGASTGAISVRVDASTDAVALMAFPDPFQWSSAASLQSTIPGQKMDFVFAISNASSASPQYVYFQINSLTAASQATLYNQIGEKISSWSYSSVFVATPYTWAVGTVSPPSVTGLGRVAITAPGTYRLVFLPNSGLIASATIQLYNAANVTGTAPVGGAAVQLGTQVPANQAVIWTIPANGEQVTFVGAGVTNYATTTCPFTEPSGSVSFQFYDQSNLHASVLFSLPASGSCTVTLQQQSPLSASLQVYNAPDVVGAITVGGPSVSLSTSVPGQRMLWNFTPTGQKVSLVGASAYTSGNYSDLKCTSGLSIPVSISSSPGRVSGPVTLPTSGTCTIRESLSLINTGSASFQIYNAPDVHVQAAVGGSAVSNSTSAPSQIMVWDFPAAGQKVTMVGTISSGLTYGSASGNLSCTASTSVSGIVNFFTQPKGVGPWTLPTSGTCSVTLSLANLDIGAATLQIFNAPDVIGTATIDGSAVTLAASVPSQSLVWNFNVTAGQSLTLAATVPSGAAYSGTTGSLSCTGGIAGSLKFNDPAVATPYGPLSISATGSCRVTLTMPGVTGNATLQIYSAPAQATGTAVYGGSPITLQAVAPGQSLQWSFAVSAGQSVGLMGSLPASVTYSAWGTLACPGLSSQSIQFNPGSGKASGPFLPSSGTCTVSLVLPGINVGNATLQVFDGSSVSGVAAAGGTAVSLTQLLPSQQLVWSFQGTAGQLITMVGSMGQGSTNSYSGQLSCANGVSGAVQFNPSGSVVASGPFTPLVTGACTVTVALSGTTVQSASLQVYKAPNVTASLASDGSASTLTTTVPGQQMIWNFSSTANQLTTFVGTLPSGVSSETGQLVCSGGFTASVGFAAGGYSNPSLTIPTSGSCSVTLSFSRAAVGNATLQMSVSTARSIPLDGTAVTQSTTSPGQVLAWSFSVSANQKLTFLASVPSGATSVTGTIACPNNSISGPTSINFIAGGGLFQGPSQFSYAGSCSLTLSFPSPATGSATLQIYNAPDIVKSITIGGAAVTAASTVPGQQLVWTFNATAGQSVTLLGLLPLTGYYAGGGVLYAPDGGYVAGPILFSVSTAKSNGPYTLSTAGTYSVRMVAKSNTPGSATLSAK